MFSNLRLQDQERRRDQFFYSEQKRWQPRMLLYRELFLETLRHHYHCQWEYHVIVSRSRGYNTFFMLNSTEHELFPPH